MILTNRDDPVDEATHGSGKRNADHGTGSDKQQLHGGVKKVPVDPPVTNAVAPKPDPKSGG